MQAARRWEGLASAVLVTGHVMLACPEERLQDVARPLMQALLPWALSHAHPLRYSASLSSDSTLPTQPLDRELTELSQRSMQSQLLVTSVAKLCNAPTAGLLCLLPCQSLSLACLQDVCAACRPRRCTLRWQRHVWTALRRARGRL